METPISAVGPPPRNEPIPNYVLKQRLGAGGYGEVWEAEAPGGLRKAVKFVYGLLDEARAQRELKSLNRIKEVRHPFLLSIERIEVVDSRLIIVTELAQGCLKTRFDECRAAGLEGIPREELLGYLNDAADALDFVHERHGLQHLDIKPENLLLVGNHAKVADFGLLKDLGESMSVLAGVTPMYSAPEAFNGRPSRHSDQYSLAIVHQEMLTGVLPFSGRTLAQLAAQHLHSPPMLAMLPPADQPVIARALSKLPEHRFPTCRGLIDSLADSEVAKSKTTRRTSRASRAAPSPAVAMTEVVKRGDSGDEPQSAEQTSTPRLAPAELRELPRIELARTKTAYRPTVLIGAGGTAGLVLSNFCRRVRARFGDLDALPAIQMLQIDTDPKDLAAALYKRGDGSIPARSTLAIPLRYAKDYRSEAKHLLEWLSRRWLYNIPRSLQTEGLRPLGRLAFVDHSRTIRDHLKRVIETAASPRSLDESRQTTGLDFSGESPAVFIIASLAGGTGSGIVFDLAYAVRTALAELGLPDRDVCGLLLHSTSRKAASRDLAVPSTLAGLQELVHFSRTQGFYPGDPDCDLPAFYGNNATFHHTYLIHLGNNLSDSAFASATDRMAEYVYQNVLSAAAPFFVQSRASDGNSPDDNPLAAGRLRTMGLCLTLPTAEGPAPTPEHSAVAAPATDAEPNPNSGILGSEFQEGGCSSSVPERTSNFCHETDLNLDETHLLQVQKGSRVPAAGNCELHLRSCGGARRTLVVAPPGVSPQGLIEAGSDLCEASSTFVQHAQREIIICQEIEDVPLRNVVALLTDSRREYPELAERLHTRIDVDWTPLIG